MDGETGDLAFWESPKEPSWCFHNPAAHAGPPPRFDECAFGPGTRDQKNCDLTGRPQMVTGDPFGEWSSVPAWEVAVSSHYAWCVANASDDS